MGKLIHNFLIAIILFIAYPSNAYSLNLVNAEISANDQSVKPVKPVKPVKNKKKKHKQAKKKQPAAIDFYAFLIIFLALVFFAGLLLFVIGLFAANFLIWLIGLCIFGILNLLLSITIIRSSVNYEHEDTPLAGDIVGIILLMKFLFDFALSVSLVVLGLIYVLPVFWIVGLSLFVLLAATIMLMITLSN
jgi:hypothetical protein